MSLDRIGFIGVGQMGFGMVKNLLEAGRQVTVYDTQLHVLDSIKSYGAIVAQSASEVAIDADVLITMLPSSSVVEDMYLKNERLIDFIYAPTIVIDCSTISPTVARKISDAFQSKGVDMIDAPVSGGVTGAEKGTLTFMCGGGLKAIHRAEPILLNMGLKIFHAGENGAGQSAKLCNNLLLAVHMIGTAEALNLGEELGIDPEVLSNIMLQSSGRNWSLESYNPYPDILPDAPSSNGYRGGFSVDLMIKDLGLAIESIMSTKVMAPMTYQAKSLYDMHRANNGSGLDFSSIMKFYNKHL
jgi:3-hydroxyisobutyrate dehydrogenase